MWGISLLIRNNHRDRYAISKPREQETKEARLESKLIHFALESEIAGNLARRSLPLKRRDLPRGYRRDSELIAK
jgi:hypothetical protein